MSEKEVKDQDQDQDASQDQDKEPTVEELVNQKVKELSTVWENKFEEQKKQIAGLDRTNSDLQKKLEEEKLSKLDEKTRADEELKKAREERERVERETEQLKRDRLIEKSVFDAGLPGEFAKRINGQTEDEISKDVKAFTGFIEAEVNKRVEVEVNKRLGGTSPEGGETPKLDDLQLAYNKAKEKGDQPTMIAILRKASSDGVQIKE